MTLHVKDFQDALFANWNERALEPWFRALVNYPKEEMITGLEVMTGLAEVDAVGLPGMLILVADNLEDDESIMPGDIFEHIRDVLEPVAVIPGSRYCDVAGLVSKHAARFFPRNVREVPQSIS